MAVVVTLVVALCLLLGGGDDQHLCCPRSRGESVESELFTCEPILLVDELNKCSVVQKENGVDGDVKFCESLTEIQHMQMADADLLPYIEYHTTGTLPKDQKLAQKIVLENQHYEVIDGILHHENPNCPGHWCIVVPSQLRTQLLTEAHSGCFGGHFSEKKVYEMLRRNYWWYGLRRDVRRFCRSCLPCVSRQGPGRVCRSPLMPIPIKGPFHRVAVDVLQLPLTSSGNRYIVVFMDYLTKWVEAFPTSDQQATTIAELLVEHIICRHGVPNELLSDRGTNFLSDIILEICSA